MSKDQLIGALLMAGSIAGILIYGYLLITPYSYIVLQLTAFVAVAGVLGILAWIGYTLATTPPPKPIEEIEKEIEEELKKLEAEMKEEEEGKKEAGEEGSEGAS
ncbi:MAG: transcriptional regulator [Thermoproteales archaeon]|nr:transcriptional regulator [Thermoproteales archaeon]